MFGARVLFVSGYTDDSILRHGVMREGATSSRAVLPVALAFETREVLDDPHG